MYIIKHRSRRAHDAPDTFYWVVCGYGGYVTIDAAVDALVTLQADMTACPRMM